MHYRREWYYLGWRITLMLLEEHHMKDIMNTRLGWET